MVRKAGLANYRPVSRLYFLSYCRRSGTQSAGCQVLEVLWNNTTFSDRSFAAAVPSVWNSQQSACSLPDSLRDSSLSAENVFAKRLKSFLVNWAAAPLAFNWRLKVNFLLLLLLLFMP